MRQSETLCQSRSASGVCQNSGIMAPLILFAWTAFRKMSKTHYPPSKDLTIGSYCLHSIEV